MQLRGPGMNWMTDMPMGVSRPFDLLRRPSRGFTLVELLIALLIGAILTTGVVAVFIQQSRAMALNEDLVDLEQNLRIAMDMLHRDVRMAGAYIHEIYPPFIVGGIDHNGDGVVDMNSDGGGSSPDAIMMQLSPDPGDIIKIYNSGGGGGAANLRVCAPSGYQIGQILPLSHPGIPAETRSIQVTAISRLTCIGVGCPGNDCDRINFSPGLSSFNTPGGLVADYEDGRVWSRLETLTYFISPDANGDGTADDPGMVRVVNRSAPLIVAFGITNLQVEYILEDGALTTTPADANQVRRVRLQLTGETRNSHSIGGATGKRTRTMVTEVQVRNLYY